MAQISGYTTRSVQPTPQFENHFTGGTDGIPMSPEARAEMERRVQELVNKLNDNEINQQSLSPEGRRLAASVIDLSDDGRLNNSWLSGSELEQRSTEIKPETWAQHSPEAAVVAMIERQPSEGDYQIIAMTSLGCVNGLRPNGLAHPEATLARIKGDYVVAA